MFIERLILTNFRCFGPDPHAIELSPNLTAFVGANGAGKTAVMQALQRLFGITNDQRRLRRQDFHVPADEVGRLQEQTLSIEAIVSFPELDAEDADADAIPEFFHQMVADDAGSLKCRLRLQAKWVDDGSLDGAIEQNYWAVRTFGDFQEETDCIELKGTDRGRIQLIYVPAARDASSQVATFLRGRLWRAINWSQPVKDAFADAGTTLNETFNGEAAVALVADAVERRWRQVYSAGTDATPSFRPIDLRFEEFVRKVEVVFRPDEAGGERSIDDLSDGQRSLFHLALTAATLDVESRITQDPDGAGFHHDGIPLPALTLIAVEEPENHLAPFYLSRIVQQVEELTQSGRAQALVSSHSASILARVDPDRVRHFRLDPESRVARVRSIRLPPEEDEASKFVREAVRAYPELYFARFVVLGEGASEEVVLPRLSEALGFAVDRSFVAVVPLGGRHVNHFWRLLSELEVPYATLLDLDWGRDGGGWGRIKTAYEQLLNNGVPPEALFGAALHEDGPDENLASFDHQPEELPVINRWARKLRQFGVYFCTPLDLDYSMLEAFPTAYQVIEPGQQGPSNRGNPRTSVLGENGHGDFYPEDRDTILRWYRYLFLGRGKPSTHVSALSRLSNEDIVGGIPPVLRALLDAVRERIELPNDAED